MLRLLTRAVVVFASSALCLVAHAQREDAPALSWVRADGAEPCPGAPEIATELEAWLGPVLVPPSQAALSVEGLVAPDASGVRFDARVVISRTDGGVLGDRRWSVGEDCAL